MSCLAQISRCPSVLSSKSLAFAVSKDSKASTSLGYIICEDNHQRVKTAWALLQDVETPILVPNAVLVLLVSIQNTFYGNLLTFIETLPTCFAVDIPQSPKTNIDSLLSYPA